MEQEGVVIVNPLITKEQLVKLQSLNLKWKRGRKNPYKAIIKQPIII